MASSKLVTTNTDLPRHPSSSSSSSPSHSSSSSSSSSSSTLLSHSHSHSHSDLLLTHSSSMDDLLNSIYTAPQRPSASPSPPHHSKTVDDVWKDMILTHSHRPSSADHHALQEMTLEAFLTKAGAVREDDVAPTAAAAVIPSPPPPPPPPPPPHHSLLQHQRLPQFPVAVEGSSSSAVEPFANGIDGAATAVVGVPPPSSSTKGKRRAVEEPVDKATLQKQKRMIKNRESAARSRERKQAYTTELEYLVQQLEMENARLLSEEAEKRKQRLKELNEFIIPVVEKRKPKKLLRTSSAQSL